jgi:AcrR family transcriptional regulator
MTTRERMIVSTALLVREKGARATSIDDVLAHSGAPRGSVYHHFPGGRDQLLTEATTYAADYVAHQLEQHSDPLALLEGFFEGYRRDLVKYDFAPGCPIVAVAIEGESGLQDLAGATFERWTTLLAERFKDRDLAVTVLASLEGALVLCRAQKSIAPLDAVQNQLRTLLQKETS